MAGQRGRDVLVSIGDGGSPESFVLVAGIVARTITLGAGLVDATTAQSLNAWRELIAGAGMKRLEVAGSGKFKDALSDERMRAAFFAGRASVFELAVAGLGVLCGPFVVAELSYSGEHEGEVEFSVRLASAGAISFEAV